MSTQEISTTIVQPAVSTTQPAQQTVSQPAVNQPTASTESKTNAVTRKTLTDQEAHDLYGYEPSDGPSGADPLYRRSS